MQNKDALGYVDALRTGGFNFDNCERNNALNATASSGGKTLEQTWKTTGTTIVGLIFKGGVCIAADTRATGGNIVGDKNCEKIHYLAPNIRCCGAGTAADCDHVTEMIKRDLELHRLNTHSESRVQMTANRCAEHLFRHGGQIGLHTIIGGVDCKGPQLMECSSDGNHYQGAYLTMGSGSLCAMGMFETYYKENMNQEEAVALVIKAVEAGIYGDLGSGSNVDVAIITRGKVETLRNIKSDNFKVFSNPKPYKFHKERVIVLNEYVNKGLVTQEVGEQPMDLS